MKKLLSLALVSSLLLFSCNKNSNGDDPEHGVLSEPTLSADASTVSLSEVSDEICLTYSWNDVAPEGTYPTYVISFALASDTEFHSAVDVNCTGTEKNLSYTQVSNLASELGGDITAGFAMIARVKASVKHYTDAFSNTVSVMVGKKQVEINELYITGDAIESDPVKMNQSGKVFTWTGHLAKKSDFKFLCQNDGTQWPAIVRDANAEEYWTAKLGSSDVDDISFRVKSAGIYTLTINAEDPNAISIDATIVTPDPKLEITELYIYGNAVTSGTSLEDMEAFVNKDGIFTWKGSLKSGEEFRFPIQKTAEWPALMITEDGEDIVYGISDDQKEVFTVDVKGIYEIIVNAVDTDEMNFTITFVSEEPEFKTIYPIGGFDWGWSQADAPAMYTEDGVVYTWTGKIYANSAFKFLCQNDGNWTPSYNRDANAENYWTLVKRSTDSDPDVQFEVAETGDYTIILNLKKLSIVVRKADEIPAIYPIGAAFDWGWTPADAPAMDTEDGITYYWKGKMWGERDFKFLCQNDGSWVPGYNRDADATDYWTMSFRTSDSDPDSQFQVPADGNYTIKLNIVTMEISVKLSQEYPKIYPIGCISDWGWNLDKIKPMDTYDGITYTIEVKIWADNNFKFLCQNTDWWPGYTRDPDAEDYFTVRYNDGTLSDDQFRLDTQGLESATYKMTLNTKTCRLSFKKVGD